MTVSFGLSGWCFVFKQKTEYEMRISDWSSDVCSSDLRGAWRALLWPKYGWPEPKLSQWRCTLAKALAMALPGSLENAAAAVGMENGKDVKGRATMLQLSRPRRIDPDGTIVWWDTPDRPRKLQDRKSTRLNSRH